MKYRFLILAFLLLHEVSAQNKIVPLNIGDDLPNVFLHKLINASDNSIYISKFKQPLIILDFWSIYCSGCIAAMPKMELLQKKFGNKIKILPVTKEPEALVRNFWKKNKHLNTLTLPSVVEDKMLNIYFNHLGEPHEAWIYKGKVIAITHGDYVDEDNITKVLNHEKLDLPLKNDFYIFNPKQALFAAKQDQISNSRIRPKYTAISGYRTGISMGGLVGGSGIIRDSIKKTIRVYFVNQPILNVYRKCLDKVTTKKLIKPFLFGESPNEVQWQVKEKAKYTYEKAKYLQSWLENNAICFESLNPDTGQTDIQVYQNVITDLDKLLNLEVRWERKKEYVYQLKFNGENNNRIARVDKTTKNKNFQIKDQTLFSLIYMLNQEAENPYVFNESSFNGKVNIDFYIPSWTDIGYIQNQLKSYGIILKKEQIEVDRLVFSEK